MVDGVRGVEVCEEPERRDEHGRDAEDDGAHLQGAQALLAVAQPVLGLDDLVLQRLQHVRDALLFFPPETHPTHAFTRSLGHSFKKKKKCESE